MLLNKSAFQLMLRLRANTFKRHGAVCGMACLLLSLRGIGMKLPNLLLLSKIALLVISNLLLSKVGLTACGEPSLPLEVLVASPILRLSLYKGIVCNCFSNFTMPLSMMVWIGQMVG